jgi:hypothetical protein
MANGGIVAAVGEAGAGRATALAQAARHAYPRDRILSASAPAPTDVQPDTTGSLGRQYWQSFWTILKLALPDKLLKATSDDAPETNSELKFRIREGVRESFGVDPAPGKRRGLRTAVRELQTAAMATA